MTIQNLSYMDNINIINTGEAINIVADTGYCMVSSTEDIENFNVIPVISFTDVNNIPDFSVITESESAYIVEQQRAMIEDKLNVIYNMIIGNDDPVVGLEVEE